MNIEKINMQTVLITGANGSAVWGGTADSRIVQSDREHHTDADAMERMAQQDYLLYKA